jgi:hypothetical protein
MKSMGIEIDPNVYFGTVDPELAELNEMFGKFD